MVRAAAIVLLVASGCARQKIDTRTAVDFEREAEAHRAHAALARHQVDVWQTTQPALSASDAMREGQVEMSPGPFTPDLYAAGRVVNDEREAEKDELIARRLRSEAEGACSRVPPSKRVSCPDGGALAKRVAIDGGVRIHLPAGDQGEGLGLVVTCAIAQSHVERPDGADACALLVPGAVVRVTGRYIEVTSEEPARAEQIRKAAGVTSPK